MSAQPQGASGSHAFPCPGSKWRKSRLGITCREAWDSFHGYRERQKVEVKIHARTVVNELTVDVSLYRDEVMENQELFNQVLAGIQNQLAATEPAPGVIDGNLQVVPETAPGHE